MQGVELIIMALATCEFSLNRVRKARFLGHGGPSSKSAKSRKSFLRCWTLRS
jgi:hypothetical protein